MRQHFLLSCTLIVVSVAVIITLFCPLSLSLTQSPRGKLKCIIRACQLLIRSLQLSKCGDPPGADDTFPALVYILIKSNPSSLLSTEQYIKTFCDPVLTGEDAYWWTQFQSAISFLRTP